MPLVQHNDLPSIERMRSEGIDVCSPNQANDSSLPSIKIGFLNMMPDAALAATERQFLRLLAANPAVNCYFHPFSVAGVGRSEQAKLHTNKYYSDFEALKLTNIDLLVVTGANVSQPFLQDELFWPGLVEVLNWARTKVRSTICSCLATHAAAKVFYDVNRKHLGEKCWGVFSHKVQQPEHLLLNKVDHDIKMCHSRFNDISKNDFIDQGVDVLIYDEHAGVQLACERDKSVVYFQGHPEYDDISLLKEYKREIIRYLAGQRNDYPPVPTNYFNQQALRSIRDYSEFIQSAGFKEELIESFPEDKLSEALDNPWKKSAHTIFSNWMTFLAS